MRQTFADTEEGLAIESRFVNLPIVDPAVSILLRYEIIAI